MFCTTGDNNSYNRCLGPRTASVSELSWGAVNPVIHLIFAWCSVILVCQSFRQTEPTMHRAMLKHLVDPCLDAVLMYTNSNGYGGSFICTLSVLPLFLVLSMMTILVKASCWDAVDLYISDHFTMCGEMLYQMIIFNHFRCYLSYFLGIR